MKATLTFDLNDEDDRYEHANAIKGTAIRRLLGEICDALRQKYKYDDKATEEVVDFALEMRQKIYDLAAQSGVELD